MCLEIVQSDLTILAECFCEKDFSVLQPISLWLSKQDKMRNKTLKLLINKKSFYRL